MKTFALCAALLLLMMGCVTRQRDHFYVLQAQPAAPRDAQAPSNRQITLRVTVPSTADRAEMVLWTQDGVAVLDHERWAAPLADLVTQTLGQDLERRRADIVVLSHSDQTGVPLVKMYIDIDQITARIGVEVSIEVHWRIIDAHTGKTAVGRDSFAAPATSGNYAAVAMAMSSCVGLLADRLLSELPAG